jgi:hypothetical protein
MEHDIAIFAIEGIGIVMKKEINKISITNDQYNQLLIDLKDHASLARDIMETYDIETLAALPYEEYHKARSRILKIKRIEKEVELGRKK